ncbi:collagenase [Thalassotalea sp. ND16A]|uniref:collagenase n=1 Tax=Thalassotalea sp. ND16A TaxID=1535422 RepID=UPI00051A510B|nr:collagenase [Thalassotalea sp. ND16A]KGJ98686.1 Microbial collagenase [Thalassotalea sp. ND16A]
MNSKVTTTLVAISTIIILGCSSLRSTEPHTKASTQAEYSKAVLNILNTDVEQLWDQQFDHYQTGLLKDVAEAITAESLAGNLNSAPLDKLTYYLRIFSSFGPDENWVEGTATTVNDALINLQNMPGFYDINATTARLHENYAVALYRLYFLKALQDKTADHVKPLARLINLYANADLAGDKAIDYALWEVIRAGAILPYEARRKNAQAFTMAIHGSGELQQALTEFLTAKNAIRYNDNWPKKHALWALAQYYNLYNKQYWNEYYLRSEEQQQQQQLDDDKVTLASETSMDSLDDTIWTALTAANRDAKNAESLQQIKELFSVPYVVTSFRGKSECEEGTLQGRCIAPTIEQALPIKHDCSARIYILTQQMSNDQLTESCQQLISQEKNFHHKLATNYQPVANDYNDKLRVVIFDDAAQYNKYGQLIFDINTDNGGMYIEGTTQDPDNEATFYSFEHFWARPEFAVWNLNHEFVHYLDGRFVKYDTFNHFPGNLVWWSEGLAEYISKEDSNPRTFKLLHETEPKEWPSLLDVFNTEYKDGVDRIYRWSYLAVRFMYENHRVEYHQMAHYLKTDFFKGYKDLLHESGKNFNDEFSQWLTKHNDGYIAIEQEVNSNKPRQFYRYTYKDYLQPSYLEEDVLHMHWQYWHENALKQSDSAVVLSN